MGPREMLGMLCLMAVMVWSGQAVGADGMADGRAMAQGDGGQKAIKNDPWTAYYDFLINEGSYKFWAVFQLVTAAVLIYSAFAAIYYAKFNFAAVDYDYGDYYLGRSNDGSSGPTMQTSTFQRIMDAIAPNRYD